MLNSKCEIVKRLCDMPSYFLYIVQIIDCMSVSENWAARIFMIYPLVNKQFDPENHPFLMVSLVFQPR